MTPNSSLLVQRKLIIALTARQDCLPSTPSATSWTDGGLLSYGPDLLGQLSARSRLRRSHPQGRKPAELPVQEPTKFDLAINLKTAKALGLAVPRTLLARADQVIE